MAVSNHDMMIATTKTGHVAQAYPSSDRCWDAPHGKIIPGDNQIDTAHLGTGKTTKTLIDGANVWTAAGLLDAAPSDPAHEGVGGGVNSGTYRKEAAPVTYSRDVKFEGSGVVRTLDRTKQNHGNTAGFVDGSNVEGQVHNAADYLKKKCTFFLLRGECEHGRRLGAPPNAKSDEAFFLDVLGGDTVMLSAVRKDLETDDLSGCDVHTYWNATRAGKGPDAMLDHVGDLFVVTGAVMADPWTGWIPTKPVETPQTGEEERYDKDKEDTKKALAEYGGGAWMKQSQVGKGNFMPQGPSKDPDVVRSVADRQRQAYNKELQDAVRKRAKVALVKDLAKAIAFWMIEREPPVVNVTAIACGGAKHVVLRVFPKDQIVFDLFSEALNAKFKLIKDISKLVEYVTGYFGVSFELKFLENPNFKLAVQYRELTEDKNNYVKTQVRKAWSLSFEFEPFFEVGCRFVAPILPLLAAFASPVIAKGAKWLMDKARVRLDFFAEIKLSLNPSITANYDEYDVGTVTGPMCKLEITFAIGFQAKVGKWGSAEFRTYVTGTLQLEQWMKAPAPALVQADFTGSVVFGISGYVKATVWGYELAAKSFNAVISRYPPGEGSSYKITTFQLPVR